MAWGQQESCKPGDSMISCKSVSEGKASIVYCVFKNGYKTIEEFVTMISGKNVLHVS